MTPHGPESQSEDYPRNWVEFEERFATEDACRAYLTALRWPAGFRCPRCNATRSWPTGRSGIVECGACHYQVSVTAGTILEDTRKPLRLWFRAMWLITSAKDGVSALGLQRQLGLTRYETLERHLCGEAVPNYHTVAIPESTGYPVAAIRHWPQDPSYDLLEVLD